MDEHASPTDDRQVPLEVQKAFAELARIVLDQPLGQFLQRVADLATQTLPDVDGLSVTLIEGTEVRSATFTSPLAAMLDERQYEAGFGPCLDAAQSGEVVRVDLDPDAVDVYPAFARAARRQGVVAVTSVGMPAPQRVVGALNLYSTHGSIDEDTVRLARVFSSYAAVALSNAALHGSTAQLAEQLQEAMSARAVIEQAKGVLMARTGVGADEAFAQLSRLSQDANVKLRVLAGRLVEETSAGRS